MNDIVAELSAMVGGKSSNDSARPARKLSPSDQSFHQIANAPVNHKAQEPKQEMATSRNNNDNFDDFNM